MIESERVHTPMRQEIFKRLNEVYEELNNHYVKGFFEWHENNPHSEWKKINELVEESIKKDPDMLCLRKIEYFKRNALELLGQYKLIYEKSKQVGIEL